MWNDGMVRRFILQWSRMLPKEFMVKTRWYRVPRSKPYLQLGCLVCWLNHKFCQWLVKMQSVWETGAPLSIWTGEDSCLWAEGTSSNTKLHRRPRVYTTTERFYSPPLLHMQPSASMQKTNTFVIEPLARRGGESVERWVEVTAEWGLSAGRAECRHRPSLSTAKGFLRAENQCGSEAAWACQHGNNGTTLFL